MMKRSLARHEQGLKRAHLSCSPVLHLGALEVLGPPQPKRKHPTSIQRQSLALICELLRGDIDDQWVMMRALILRGQTLCIESLRER